MTYATTFSGIGGWELGLNACGWKLKWQCERDAFCRTLLRERFRVPICPDILGLYWWVKRLGGAGNGPDPISAGCQELDSAGLAARPGHRPWTPDPTGFNWATEPDVGRVAHGITSRVDRVRGLGNAVIPQIPFIIGQAINEMEMIQ